MPKKNLIWVSDWDIALDGEPQSGYSQISATLCKELGREYNIIALGISYRRNQHYIPIGLTHVSLRDLPSAILSIKKGLGTEINDIVVALDIPQQIELSKVVENSGLKYTGIMAVESDPVIMQTAIDLYKVNNRLIISQFGADECVKAGVDATHIPIPLDLNKWKFKSNEEKQRIRMNLGYKENDVIFLVNGDSNERKNLSTHYKAFGKALEKNPNVKMIVVTRKKSPFGWNYDELENRFGIQGKVITLERGMPHQDLWNLYACADCLVNATKSEGLGLAILESFAVGTPVIATNATAMKESISDDRGIPVEPFYVHTDVFLNGNRYYVHEKELAQKMLEVAENISKDNKYYFPMVEKARRYVEGRTVEKSVKLLREILEK